MNNEPPAINKRKPALADITANAIGMPSVDMRLLLASKLQVEMLRCLIGVNVITPEQLRDITATLSNALESLQAAYEAADFHDDNLKAQIMDSSRRAGESFLAELKSLLP